jgi:hypothetical protein
MKVNVAGAGINIAQRVMASSFFGAAGQQTQEG